MTIEIRKWTGVLMLVCFGFAVGRLSLPPLVNANPQDSEIGRYQLVAGSYMNKAANHEITYGIFRIDTNTGTVEEWSVFQTDKGFLTNWNPLLPKEFIPEKKR